MIQAIISRMLNEILKDPVWVDSYHKLDRIVADLAGSPFLAVDTESNSLFAYQEQVCLIQFSTPTSDYLIDPLAISDLSPLEPIFSDPQTEKIFHAAEYDIICLKRDFGFSFNNLFDTMVAARILGRPAVGLGSVLEAEFGIQLDKRYQRANWGQRPLPPAQKTYARFDSHYLIALRQRLSAELIDCGLWELAQEDFNRLCQTPIPVLDNPSDACWRLAGRTEITPRQAAVLQALCTYRDTRARQTNQPQFKVLSNSALVELALAAPQNRSELMGIQSISPRLLERHAEGLLNAIRQGQLAAPPPRPRRNHHRDEELSNRQDALRLWRKETAQSLKVESDVVLPRDVMQAIADVNPENLNALEKIMESVPYRFKRFGADILHAIQN
ncbi:ribonuclease D [Longilinea arvoryzae]|uniref:Ribonuclease D n=1 Tax=Longilinea arvoryzae TaxID=360412 RepID=A0A0S7BK18_9CHLR|nr:ribonuclease D [Longilinea arvoryzae]GAP13994.1 ribonuclease D [Longilinea arvoryzae]